jgi:hypothetical protein
MFNEIKKRLELLPNINKIPNLTKSQRGRLRSLRGCIRNISADIQGFGCSHARINLAKELEFVAELEKQLTGRELK